MLGNKSIEHSEILNEILLQMEFDKLSIRCYINYYHIRYFFSSSYNFL